MKKTQKNLQPTTGRRQAWDAMKQFFKKDAKLSIEKKPPPMPNEKFSNYSFRFFTIPDNIKETRVYKIKNQIQ